MSTITLELVATESDELSRRELFDKSFAESFTEKYDSQLNVPAQQVDLEVTPPEISSAKMVVIISSLPIDIKLNSNVAVAIAGVKMLAMAASGINSLFLSNPSSSTAASVRILIYE